MLDARDDEDEDSHQLLERDYFRNLIEDAVRRARIMQGLARHQLDSTLVTNMSKAPLSFIDMECPICKEPHSETSDGKTIVLRYGAHTQPDHESWHCFQEQCIRSYFDRGHTSCPNCRQDCSADKSYLLACHKSDEAQAEYDALPRNELPSVAYWDALPPAQRADTQTVGYT